MKLSPINRARIYRLQEWLRKKWSRYVGMRLAVWLDERHPDWCWAQLCVDIGLGEIKTDNPLRFKDNSVCQRDRDWGNNQSCWCGKLWRGEPPFCGDRSAEARAISAAKRG